LIYVNNYLTSRLSLDNFQEHICHKALYGYDEPCPDCPMPELAGRDETDTHTVQREVYNPLLNRHFMMHARLVPWHDGRPVYMAVGTDITEHRALAMAEAATLAQKEFLARMSHELRTPMNGVLGMTRLALQADPPPVQQTYLKKIQSSASLLLGIINDILDFSRIEAGKMSIERHGFDLRQMVDNVCEIVMPRITEKNLEFHLNVDASVPRYVMGDELRLSQILLNLLGNASKFTLQGAISLFVEATPSPGAPQKLRLRCRVRDSGIGMDDEQRRSLFKPFSQADVSTSRKFGGTGLGLSISRALVELMGGTISVESTPGRGSEFMFTVEMETLDGPPQDIEAAGDAPGGGRCDGSRILLVEDNEINQEIAIALLQDMGATVDVADNGEKGLAAFMEKDYDLILMDVRMPVMDGLEAARRIRAAAKHDAVTIPIIAMTANAMQEDRQNSEDAGMNAHIAKPIDVRELRKVVCRYLKRSDG
jgi:signal transduction histidine kinase/CheY-like chemotaxis protein